MTAQTWIDATRDLLLTDYVEEQATLSGTLTASASDILVSFTLPTAIVPGAVEGATFEIGTELFYVYSVSGAGQATCRRGFRGSTIATHANGDEVTVNPKFPAYMIFNALNDDLLDLASPQNGLYQVKTKELTFNSSQDGYDLTSVTDDILDIYQVTWSETGPEASEPVIPRFTLRRNRNTTDFPSGFALVLHDDAESGRTFLVEYKTPFTALASATAALSTVGIHTSAYDVPVLGAAMRLMASRPIRREFLDEQGFSRRAEEVPSGGPSASMRDLRALRTARVEAEAARLDSYYPTVWNRGGQAGTRLSDSALGRFS